MDLTSYVIAIWPYLGTYLGFGLAFIVIARLMREKRRPERYRRLASSHLVHSSPRRSSIPDIWRSKNFPTHPQEERLKYRSAKRNGYD